MDIKIRRLGIALWAVSAVWSQNPPQNSAPDESVIRVQVDLVQVDAIVTDAKGKPVNDLKPEDFEIQENGKTQHITNFSFIQSGTQSQVEFAPGGKTVSSVAPARLAPEQVNRTIVIVVDDLGMDQQSFSETRVALKKLIETQLQPGDLVGLVSTSGRLGGMQRLTADKRFLLAALEHLRSLPAHRVSVRDGGKYDDDDDYTCVWFKYHWGTSGDAAGAPVMPGEIQDEQAVLVMSGTSGHTEILHNMRDRYFSLMSVAALRRVVDNLRNLPGRKSIVLLSEGLAVQTGQKSTGSVNPDVRDAFESFLTHANRSAIAVNTVDPRGLVPAMMSDSCSEARDHQFVYSRQLLAEIAQKTAGIAISQTNDLAGALGRVLTDQAGYYLIGYKPSGAPVKDSKSPAVIRKIAIKVNRPGLKARFHSNLYDESSVARAQASADPNRHLTEAAASPFSLQDIRVRLSTQFWDSGTENGSLLHTSLQVDARDLKFSEESDGRRKAEFDLLALVFGTDSKPLDSFAKHFSIALTPETFATAQTEGIIQNLTLPLKKPGPYQIRAAVRDSATDRVGSASEFLEVPDLSRAGLALSGIVLRNHSLLDTSDQRSGMLRYHRGQTVFYNYQVFNPYADKEGNVDVQVQVSLLRQERVLGTSPSIPVNAQGQADRKHLLAMGDMRLSKQLPPGDYTLQIRAEDRKAPAKKAKPAIQSIDFEVIE